MMSVPDIMYTSNPIHDYEFSWTIENFSFSPDVLRGPSVAPIPGFPLKVCYQLEYNLKKVDSWPCLASLKVFLIDLSVKDSSLVVSCCTTILNTDDKIFEYHKISNAKFKDHICLLDHHFNDLLDPPKLKVSQRMNLLEDKLVVKSKLSFAGYNIVTSPLIDKYEAGGESLKEDLKCIYKSGMSSDVMFSVGTKTLRAHKIILQGRSPVFAKMFNSDMLEGNSNRVVIKDSDSHAFNCFLVFLYTDVVEDKTLDTVRSFPVFFGAHVPGEESSCDLFRDIRQQAGDRFGLQCSDAIRIAWGQRTGRRGEGFHSVSFMSSSCDPRMGSNFAR